MADVESTAPLRVRWADSLSDVPRNQWDEISAELGLYYSHRWLAMLEANPGARVRYLLVWRGDIVVAGMPVQDVLNETLRNYRPDKHAAVTGGGRWLLAGTRRAYSSGVAVHSALTGAERREAVQLVVDAARDYAASAGYDGVVWMYATTSAAADLVRCGARAGLATAEAIIRPAAAGLDAYLSAFSAHRGREMRREMRVFEGAGYEVSTSALSGCWEEAGQLLLNIQRKYGHETTLQAEQASLRSQADALDDQSVVVCVRDEGRLVGFTLFYRWNSTLYARVAGFDYTAVRRAYEYFNVAYYRPVALMADLGLGELHLGTGSLDAKIARGAVLRPLWMAAVPVDPDNHVDLDVRPDLRAWRDRYPAQAIPAAEWEPAWLTTAPTQK
ncbi:GNAT family N-acetyltransferase [Krasilnikovia sp. MM14-A1004]|uniref:GNAT family N-acetyltransferase n=1 Tax=Krasilnikovia sp. MM14-A1004 TaxID=3373541 RepID=UPI00399CA267